MTESKAVVNVEVEIECGIDASVLSDIEWFMLSGGSPRKERNHRRNAKTKSWKFVDLCTWIGIKVCFLFK